MASTYSRAFQCPIITFKEWWAASHCELCARSRECLSPGFHRNLVRWKCSRQWTVYWWFWDSHTIRQKFICYREKPWRWSVLVCEQKLVQHCYHTRHARHWDAVFFLFTLGIPPAVLYSGVCSSTCECVQNSGYTLTKHSQTGLIISWCSQVHTRWF